MPLTVEQDAAEKIRAANHKVLQVCHVASAGDSGEGKDIVLYLAPERTHDRSPLGRAQEVSRHGGSGPATSARLGG